MAWARPPGAPQLPSCPLEVLEPRENEYVPLFTTYLLPYLNGTLGFFFPGLINKIYRRPFYSGIFFHLAAALGSGYLTKLFLDKRRELLDDKDEVLRQYITLHPEDFPPYNRKLLKDIIEPWTPVR